MESLFFDTQENVFDIIQIYPIENGWLQPGEDYEDLIMERVLESASFSEMIEKVEELKTKYPTLLYNFEVGEYELNEFDERYTVNDEPVAKRAVDELLDPVLIF